jgi:hypothetical protein
LTETGWNDIHFKLFREKGTLEEKGYSRLGVGKLRTLDEIDAKRVRGISGISLEGTPKIIKR